MSPRNPCSMNLRSSSSRLSWRYTNFLFHKKQYSRWQAECKHCDRFINRCLFTLPPSLISRVASSKRVLGALPRAVVSSHNEAKEAGAFSQEFAAYCCMHTSYSVTNAAGISQFFTDANLFTIESIFLLINGSR